MALITEDEEKEGLEEQPAPWEPLQSSHVAAKRYDSENLTLYVLFQDGAMWAYEGVPPEVNEQFGNSPSPGRFMASEIKPFYPAARSI